MKSASSKHVPKSVVEAGLSPGLKSKTIVATRRCGLVSFSRKLIWFWMRLTASLVIGFWTVTNIASLAVSCASVTVVDASKQATAAANRPEERLIGKCIGDRSFGVRAEGSPYSVKSARLFRL